ncbi:MAG: hypothetical protein HC817_03590 [Saprospiraceae bacterium]|nr:hypothetical protein [Saprospiraceae bacterium]
MVRYFTRKSQSNHKKTIEIRLDTEGVKEENRRTMHPLSTTLHRSAQHPAPLGTTLSTSLTRCWCQFSNLHLLFSTFLTCLC